MKKVIFKFDKEKDLYNIWESCNSGLSYGYDFKKDIPKTILKICRKKKFIECKKELQKKMEKEYKSPVIKIVEENINKSWEKIEGEFFKRFEKITKEPFYCKEVIGYLTTAPRCPYRPDKKPPYFYVSIFWSIPTMLSAASHELMHLQFHNTRWKNVEKEIGHNKTHDLKESLTILLNLEFRDLWLKSEGGYPNHIKLRKFIEKEWKKKKDFNTLINKCIKYLKGK